jgi:Asp-tRNA(Asn)/Glu-tRNA(Gln) amidotransferase A subunit family amidase
MGRGAARPRGEALGRATVTYDLRSLKLPRLGTGALKVMASLVENPLIGPSLVGLLKKQAGLTRIRTDVAGDAPTYFPLLDADERALPPFAAAASHAEPPGFHFPGIDDFTRAYREGRCAPEEIAERFLAQRERSERDAPGLKAFIAVDRDDVMAQAKASGARWRAGAPTGEFDGVPVAVKDELDQTGYGTTAGTRFIGSTRATYDATVVARLRAAGALLVGKANMHELGINVTGLNPHHGTTRNPYDDRFHTGGSSSGPATVVASGLAPVAIGADGGGSIRMPAAMCGIVGLKATFGRISDYGAFPLCWSLAHLGPMAASVRDCARAYALIAGPDPLDPLSLGHPPVEIDGAPPADLRGVTLGVYWPWFRHASPDVVDRCETLLRALVDRGATLREVEIDGLDMIRVAHIITITSEMVAAMMPYDREHRRDFGLDARVNLASARGSTAAEYVQAQRVRTGAIAEFQRVLSEVDAIITPATGIVAPRINPAAQPLGESDLSTTTEIMRFAFPSNFTGHPAISFPAGYDSNGLPVGMQAIGRPWGERLLLRIAAAAELIVERRAPKRWYPLLEH